VITVSPKHRIFIAIQPIDFRYGIDGIVKICRNKHSQDPMSGHYFIFRNKRKTDIKLLYYDSQGFCLFQKRLSKGRFNAWPTAASPMLTLTPSQLHVLIHNGDPAAVKADNTWRPIIDESPD
jgi:transposase